ncbi:MAG TPA: nuclear transport factor 2 family protein [Actinospica sp.]|nr:nuclear transport factor 2 family protein [Actinospica sp.]
MSLSDTSSMFDIETLRRGIEMRDAAAMRGLYAENALMTLVDQRDQPSHPHEIVGAAAIGAFLDEICSRDMEHHLDQVVVSADGTHAAYLEQCRYPDGTKVLSTSMLDLRDGRIAAQTSVQAWDDSSAGGTDAPTAAKAEHRSFSMPDEMRPFEHGRMELLSAGGGSVGRARFEPGWRWSQDVKPIAGTDLCEAPHFCYQTSGTLHVRMADGTEFDLRAGDLAVIPPGHDAWVVGDETVEMIDWQGALHYAEKG